MNGRPFTPEERREIIRLYVEEKVGVDSIGARFGRKSGVGVWRMLRREGIEIRNHNESLKHRVWHIERSDQWRARQRIKSFVAQANTEAAAFHQPTLITFLPENPQLEADWRAILSSTRQERAEAARA